MKTRTPLFRIDRFLIAALALLAAPQVQAQSNLVTWGVNGLAASPAPSAAPTTNTVATGITASSITRGSGISSLGTADSFSSTNWSETSFANAIANGDFYTFTISAQANYSFSISNFTATIARSGTGATNTALATSLDSFATAIGSTNVPSSAGTRSFTNSALTNITTSVEFRLAGWNAGGPGGTMRFVAGTTNANPFLSGTTTLRSASILTWDGGRGSGSWTAYDATNANQANWNGNNTPLNGDSLLFAGTTQTNTTNDVSSLLANAIVFSNTAGTFAISGNALTVSNGITNLSTSGQTFSNAITLGAAQTFNASAGNLVFAGNVANGNNLLTVNGSGNSTFSQQISGGGGLTKNGAGSLFLSGTSTYGGATTLNAGTTRLSGSVSSSAVTVNDTAILEGAGTTGGLTINSGGRVAPGNGAVGTLSVSSLTLAGGGGYNWELNSVTGTAGTNWDLINVGSAAGTVTVSSTSGSPFTIFINGTWAASGFSGNSSYNWRIIDAGTLTGFAADKFTVNTTGFTGGTATGTWGFSDSSGDLVLSYTAPVLSSTYGWIGGSGSWGTAGNWTNNATPTNGSSLLFSGAAGTATNEATLTSVSGVNFSNTSGSFVLAGDAFAVGVEGIKNESGNSHAISNNLSFSANASINAASNALTIAGNVTNDVASQVLTVTGDSNTDISGVVSGQGGVTKSGAGSLTLNGNNTFTGNLAVNNGTALLNGTQDTTTINVGGGILLLGGNEKIASGATLTLSSGIVNFGGFGDTLDTLNISGGVFTNGTATATTFGLSGGTVGGVLSGGTANVTGGVALSGTIASTLNINSGGTLTLAAADRIDSGSAVTINAGTLATAGFNDSIASLVLTNGGSMTGSGTITAGSYTLNGGTVTANLGAGTATSSAGTTTLNGTLAGDLAVSGGTLNLGSGDLIGTGSAVTVSSGTLGMGTFNDTVGSFTITGGTLGGTTGVLAASTYALQGGTINARLGAGAITVTSGTTTLGSAGRLNSASTLTINSGQLSLGGAETVASLSGAGGTLALGANALTFGNSGNATFGGVISGSAGITKAGTGTATLSGANTYTGTTLVNAGTLRLGDGGASGSLASTNINITNASSVLLVDRTGTLSLSALISGNGSLVKTGAGTLNLTSSNSYSGGSTINGGAIQIDGLNRLGDAGGTLTINDGKLLVSTGLSSARNIVLGNANSTIEVGAGFSYTATSTSIFSGSGTLNKTGTGTLALQGTNTYLGGNLVAAGTLEGDTTSLRGTITNNGVVSFVQATNGTFANAITGSGSLVKSGTAILTLSAANGFDGAVTVSAGTLRAANNNALGSTVGGVSVASGAALELSNSITIGSEALSLTGTGVSSGGALRNVSGNNTFGGAITLAGATTIQSASGTSLTLTGGIGGTGQALTINGTGNTTISGTGINTGTGGALTKDQAGILTITAGGNYTGGSTLSAGTTRVGDNSALGSGAITTSGGAVLASDSATARTLANNFTIGGNTTFGEATTGTGNLTLNGTLGLGGGARTISVANGLTTINGVISGTSGNSLTKGGTGSLVLNAANTYSGATTVSAGTLALGASGALSSSTITVDSGATLDLTAKASGYALGNATLGGVGTVNTASGQTLSIGSGSTIRPATASASGTLTVSGLTFGTGGTYAFSIGNVSGAAGTAWDLINVTSAFDIAATSGLKFTITVAGNSGNPVGFSNTGNYSWDILTLGSGSISGFDASKFNLVNNFVGSSGTLSLTTDGSKLTLNYAAGDANIVAWSSAGGSAWLSAANWTGSVVPTDIDVAQFGLNPTPGTTVGINMGNNSGAQSVGAIEVTSSRANALTVNNSSGSAVNAGILTLGGARLSAIDNVVLRNNSTQLLTLANGSSATMGVALGNATDNVVLIDSTGGITISSIISGASRKLTKAGSGSGILTLSGANTFSGGVDLDTGTLRLNNASAAGTGTLTQADGTSTLQINVAGTIANNMSLYNVAFLQGGRLSGNLTLNNTIFDVTNNVTATNSGILSGGGGVQKIGAGTLVLSGANTYAGATSISNGAISVSADNNLGAAPGSPTAGNVTLDGGKLLATTGFTLNANRGVALGASGGTIEVASGQAVSYGGVAAGAGAFTKSGAGSMTFSGANTYSGATTVSAGTLELANTSGAAIGSTTSISVATNATLLISQNLQVNNSAAAVSLSGGTIRTAAGVDETFGNLSITGSGFLDFGTTSYANANTISFGSYNYTPSALLSINNFNFGSTLTFSSNLSAADLATFSFTNGGIASSSWNGSTFTITAIPEPSTYLAAVGLLSLMLWPSRKRLLKDAKKILGLTAPMRDRLASRRA